MRGVNRETDVIKALVVDDDLIMRRLVASMLKKCFTHVHTAESGEQAVTLLEQHDFGLVITDLRMGQMDGLEVVRRVKKRAADTLVIMMSGNGKEQSRLDAFRAGVDAYMEKPFSVTQLLEHIRSGKPEIFPLIKWRCETTPCLSI